MTIQSVASPVSQPILKFVSQDDSVKTSNDPAKAADIPAVVVTINSSSVQPQSASDQLSRTVTAENAMLAIYNKTDWSKMKGLTADQLKTAQADDAKKFVADESDTIAFATANSLDTSKVSFTPVSAFNDMPSGADFSVSKAANIADTSADKSSQEMAGSGISVETEKDLDSNSSPDVQSADRITSPNAASVAALAVLQAAAKSGDNGGYAKADLYV